LGDIVLDARFCTAQSFRRPGDPESKAGLSWPSGMFIPGRIIVRYGESDRFIFYDATLGGDTYFWK
jgi:hypothetical protein